MWIFHLLTTLTLVNADAPTPSVPQQLVRARQLSIWPGDKFPDRCPAGFQASKELEENSIGASSEDRATRECDAASQTEAWRHLTVRRSGTFTASVSIELAPQKKKSCDPKALTDAFGKALTEAKNAKFGQNGQAASVWSVDDQQVWTALTCTKIPGLADTLTLKIETSYSGLENFGKPPLGLPSRTQGSAFGGEAPFFPPRGASGKEISANLEADVKRAEPLTRSFSNLGLKLFKDNVSWRSNPARIQRSVLRGTTKRLQAPANKAPGGSTANANQGQVRLRGQSDDQSIRPESPCVAECMKAKLTQEGPSEKCTSVFQALARGKAVGDTAQECQAAALEKASQAHKACAEQCR